MLVMGKELQREIGATRERIGHAPKFKIFGINHGFAIEPGLEAIIKAPTTAALLLENYRPQKDAEKLLNIAIKHQNSDIEILDPCMNSVVAAARDGAKPRVILLENP